MYYVFYVFTVYSNDICCLLYVILIICLLDVEHHPVHVPNCECLSQTCRL